MDALKKYLTILLISICLLLLLIGSFNISRISFSYLNFDPTYSFLATKQLAYRILHWRVSFYLHVFSSFLLLICGLIQFIPYILEHYKKIHRFSGYIYMIVLLIISGPAAFVMSIYANGGIAAQASFILMCTLWYFFTLISLIKVYQKNYYSHADFLLRSFALTCSALTLRFYAMLLSYSNIEAMPREKYILIAWLSWVPNLLVAEWIIQSGILKKIFTPKIISAKNQQ